MWGFFGPKIEVSGRHWSPDGGLEDFKIIVFVQITFIPLFLYTVDTMDGVTKGYQYFSKMLLWQ